jgi:hypothetical protein
MSSQKNKSILIVLLIFWVVMGLMVVWIFWGFNQDLSGVITGLAIAFMAPVAGFLFRRISKNSKKIKGEVIGLKEPQD